MNSRYIPKINGYSLSDFHDFENCTFRFFVKHHLDKKYEMAKGSPQMALGVLLDQTIKVIHSYGEKSYRASPERLVGAVKYSVRLIKAKEANNPRKPNFDSATVAFLNEEIIMAAENILLNYLKQIDNKLKKSLGEIGFCQRVLEIDGDYFKLWGGPDTLEEGRDGVPEIIDYKSRQDVARGKKNMDMDLMPKLYTLLVADWLKAKGYKKARFMVKFWQDPKDESFSEEFDLENLTDTEDIFKQKIKKILKTVEAEFCITEFCDACNYETKDDFALELKNKHGISIIMR